VTLARGDSVPDGLSLWLHDDDPPSGSAGVDEATSFSGAGTVNRAAAGISLDELREDEGAKTVSWTTY
jgi:hypothetical protein